MHGSRRPLSPASSGSSRLLLHAPSSSSTPPTSSAFFQHRLRNQPTPSLPNLRSAPVPLASPRPPHHLDHPADRMPDDHSLPPQSPTSPLAALPTSASDLQRHLYASFLEGKTADVSLRINGSWRATYRLHRVVLIQAGFFKSLFTAGFVESMTKASSSKHESEVIDIVFDDPNITRAAFEICIARLYGGGPPIHVAQTLIPTAAQPLTPTVPFIASDSVQQSPCPPYHHPTTPRFLLSLLATAVFLSIPSVASQTLTTVLTTVGPRTVLRYLNFAIGEGIGDPDEDEPEAAVGLETIAVMAADSDGNDSRKASSAYGNEQSQSLSSLPETSSRTDDMEIKKEDPANSFSESSFLDSNSSSDQPSPTFFYGGVSNKIGEAAVCWLTRWGADILRYEEESMGPNFTRLKQDFLVTPGASSSTRKRATTIPFHSGAPIHRPSASSNAGTSEAVSGYSMPLIWRRGGLDARWVRRILSSDALFVKGEKERYNMACSVVDLRRKDGILDEDEDEWKILFERGIYYANMHLDELVLIAKDLSPATGKPYAPLSVLQTAHWDQSLLHHHISHSSVSTNPTLSPRPKELGLSVMMPDVETDQQFSTKLFYPVPEDSSSRLGDSAGLENASMDQLFDLSPMRKSASTGGVVHTSESNCFGLDQQAFSLEVCKYEDPKGKGKWTPYPPMRFGVEFWDIEALKEKSRLHSQTVWYAGSLWNVYVQVVRKKGVQLGVYLHRQSSVDPIPPASAPLPSVATGVAVPQPQHVPLSARPSSPHSRSSTPYSTPASPTRPSSLPNSYSTVHVNNHTGNTIPATAPPVTPPAPYRDSRAAVSAYFTIACASATGANLTKFTSAPDVFSVSQSWGWKSSSLRTEEYLEISEDGVKNVMTGKEVSLRATIVLGIV